MISCKKLVDYLRTLPEYLIDLSGPCTYIVQDSKCLGIILVDSTDFGAVIRILDNREPHQISDLLSHFTYEIIHINYEYTSIGQYIVKLLDFK